MRAAGLAQLASSCQMILDQKCNFTPREREAEIHHAGSCEREAALSCALSCCWCFHKMYHIPPIANA